MAVDGKPAWVDQSGYGLKFVDNQLIRPSFQLQELGTTDLANFELVARIVMRVGNFAVRNPARNVRAYPVTVPNPDEENWNSGPQHPQPGPPSEPGGLRTRWDVDVSNAAPPASGRRPMTQIRVVLAEGLSFWEPDKLPAITAKSADAATRLVNLKTFVNGRGRPVATFFALGPVPGGQPVLVEDGINIAVVAKDSNDATFSLPLIIDPPIRNRIT